MKRVPITVEQHKRLRRLALVVNHSTRSISIAASAIITLDAGLAVREHLWREQLFRLAAHEWFHRKAAA